VPGPARADADPRARAAAAAVRSGDTATLAQLLGEHPELAGARIVDDDGTARTLLHVATDWPGHFPAVAATIALLARAGADVDARTGGDTGETPLHWAASSDDVEAVDALLDAGAAVDAPGAVIAGGTPLSDAVAFAQWAAARRLLERGARPSLREAAALGLLPQVAEAWAGGRPPPAEEATQAFWYACHGGQRDVAGWLLARGAERDWVSGWDGLTPLDAARRSGAHDVVAWLESEGARSAAGSG